MGTENKAKTSQMFQLLTDQWDCWLLHMLFKHSGSQRSRSHRSKSVDMEMSSFPERQRHKSTSWEWLPPGLMDNSQNVFWNSAYVQHRDDCYRKFHPIWFHRHSHNLSISAFYPSVAQLVHADPSAGESVVGLTTGSKQQGVSELILSIFNISML